jgi:hypothetical protein
MNIYVFILCILVYNYYICIYSHASLIIGICAYKWIISFIIVRISYSVLIQAKMSMASWDHHHKHHFEAHNCIYQQTNRTAN